MNIFVLDQEPKQAAAYHVDRHVIKMILESAQMLSTAHRVLDGIQYIDKTSGRRNIQRWRLKNDLDDSIFYQATHINHPCSRWVRESDSNYQWLYELFLYLSTEYVERYQKDHLTWDKLGKILEQFPRKIKVGSLTPFALAMPEQYRIKHNPVQSYRQYYISEKSGLFSWKNKPSPYWISEKINANL